MIIKHLLIVSVFFCNFFCKIFCSYKLYLYLCTENKIQENER
nr:MAG TPA: hypothetical protein [Caudoviricetes sp.]